MKKLFRLPAVAHVLGGRALFGSTRLLLKLLWFSVTRKLWLRDVPLYFSVSFQGSPVAFYLWNNVDLATCIEVFVDEEYAWDAPEAVTTIIDAGANIGLTSLYYTARYPEAVIYALEPAPETFKRLQRNVSAHHTIHALEVGLGATDGSATFHVPSHSIGSSLKRAGDDTTAVTIDTVTIATLVRERSLGTVDLVKFDIEGAEQEVFDQAFDTSLARYYIGEVHEDIMDISATEFAASFGSQHTLTPTGIPGRFIITAAVV